MTSQDEDDDDDDAAYDDEGGHVDVVDYCFDMLCYVSIAFVTLWRFYRMRFEKLCSGSLPRHM